MVGEEETDRDTIVFHFDVECTPEIITKPNGDEAYVNENALSGALTWLAQGNQEEMFPGKQNYYEYGLGNYIYCLLM